MDIKLLTARQVINLLQSLSSPTVAIQTQKFFKIGPGHYTLPTDKFIGISTPVLRQQLKNIQINLNCLKKLLHHQVHEIRLFALFYLVQHYRQAHIQNLPTKPIVEFYLDNFEGVNNWDLVDSSAHQILGHYLYHYASLSAQTKQLKQLSFSTNMWEQRLAIVSTYYFIKQNSHEHTLTLAKKYLSHEHDLIHKATGWMLREVGKQHKPTLIAFLKQYANKMPRVMYRYSVEKLSEKEKASF